MFFFGFEYVLCDAPLERNYRHPLPLKKKTGKTVYFRLAIDPLLWPWTHSSGHGLTRLVMDSLVWSWTRLAVDSLVRPELLSLLLLKAELSKKHWNWKGIVYT